METDDFIYEPITPSHRDNGKIRYGVIVCPDCYDLLRLASGPNIELTNCDNCHRRFFATY